MIIVCDFIQDSKYLGGDSWEIVGFRYCYWSIDLFNQVN